MLSYFQNYLNYTPNMKHDDHFQSLHVLRYSKTSLISQEEYEDVQQYMLNSFYFRFRPLIYIKENSAGKLNWNTTREILPGIQRL